MVGEAKEEAWEGRVQSESAERRGERLGGWEATMEANKEQATKCLNIARRSLREGDAAKARRFAEKAGRLGGAAVGDQVAALLREIETGGGSSANGAAARGSSGASKGTEELRRRRNERASSSAQREEEDKVRKLKGLAPNSIDNRARRLTHRLFVFCSSVLFARRGRRSRGPSSSASTGSRTTTTFSASATSSAARTPSSGATRSSR